LTATSPINPTLLFSGIVFDNNTENVFIGTGLYSKIEVYALGLAGCHITINLPNSGGQGIADDAGIFFIIQTNTAGIGDAIFLAVHNVAGVSQTLVRMAEDTLQLQPTAGDCEFNVYAYKK
jgi:hypothetical protein